MLNNLTSYIRKKLPGNFKGWTQEALEDYLMWQIERNQLVAAVDAQGSVRAIVIGWPTEEMQVESFRWQETTEHGRFWYWDQIAGDNPIALMSAFAEMFRRRPESASLPSYGVRHRKVRFFGTALDVYKTGEKIYGN
jgi:hypothetical protein